MQTAAYNVEVRNAFDEQKIFAIVLCIRWFKFEDIFGLDWADIKGSVLLFGLLRDLEFRKKVGKSIHLFSVMFQLSLLSVD